MPRTVAYPLRDHPELCVITTYDEFRNTEYPSDDSTAKVGTQRANECAEERLSSVEFRVSAWGPSERIGAGEFARWWITTSISLAGVVWMSLWTVERHSDLWSSLIYSVVVACLSILILWTSLVSLLYESAVALPSLGIQLNQTDGITIPLLTPRIHIRSRRQSDESIRWIPISIIFDRHRFVHPTSTSKTFIPRDALPGTGGRKGRANSVFLNEGFRRWSVKFYLGLMVVKQDHQCGQVDTGAALGEGPGVRPSPSILRRKGERRVHVVFEKLAPCLAVLEEVYYGLRETMFMELEEALDTG